jgi:Sigma-70, region 4/Carboxypeptidase regulatory-like domain
LLRGRTRAARRELATAPPPPEPSPLDLAEREATIRAVTDALLALPEPYKRTLILRHYEGLPPREIARREGVSVEAIRSRLQRGAAMMRARMEGKPGANPTMLAPGLFALATPPDGEFLVDVARAELRRFANSIQRARTPLAAGTLAACTLTTVVLVAARVFDSAAGADPRIDAPIAAVPNSPPVRESIAPLARGSSTTAELVAADPTPPRLVVRVKRADGSLAPAVAVELIELAVANSGLAPRRATTDDEGAVTFDGVRIGPVTVAAGFGAVRELEYDASISQHVTLTIPRGIEVRGVVRDAFRRPLAGARIFHAPFEDRDSLQFTPVAVSDGSGAFLLRDVPPGSSLVALAENGAPTASEFVAGLPGTFRLLELLADARPARLTGRVVTATGSGAAARLAIEHSLGTFYFDSANDGAFDLRGLPAGRARVIARDRAHWRAEREVDLIADGATSIEFTLPLGGELTGRVTNQDGTPAAYARVTVHGDSPLGESRTCADRNGEYRQVGLAPGPCHVEFRAGAASGARIDRVLRAGERVLADVILAAAPQFTGVVSDATGRGLAGVEVRGISGNGKCLANAVSGAAGAFRIPAIDSIGHLLFFESGGIAPAATITVDTANRRPLAVTLDVSAQETGSIAGRVTHLEGAGTWIRCATELGFELDTSPAIAADGSFVLAPLPPGAYRLVAEADDGRRSAVVTVVIDGTPVSPVNLALAPLAEVAILAASPAPLRDRIAILSVDGQVVASIRGADLPARLRIPAGSYAVRFGSNDRPHTVAFDASILAPTEVHLVRTDG